MVAQFRLEAYRHWLENATADNDELSLRISIFKISVYSMKSKKLRKNLISDSRSSFEKARHFDYQTKVTSGDAVFNSVSVAAYEELLEMGVIFCSFTRSGCPLPGTD